MDSFSPNSSSTPTRNRHFHHHHHLRDPNIPPSRYRQPSQPISDRIVRALRHRLRLLHRSASTFFILGATGNVYTVSLSSSPFCTCPDRTTPCKHILFVLIRVLGVPLEDACLRRKTLRPCQLQRLLSQPSSPDSFAGDTLRQRFHQLFFGRKQGGGSEIVIEEGASCPVCLEEMGKEEKLVACRTCRNAVHEECFVRWRRSSKGRGGTRCVMCRARWKDRAEQDEYLNLSEYLSDDDDDAAAAVDGDFSGWLANSVVNHELDE